MIEADRPSFFAMLADVYAFYRRDFSQFAGSVWWAAMRPYDLAAVTDALGRHCVNPDTGQFLPKPADVVRMLQGGTQDCALVAWAKVDRAVRHVGAWQSVVFDDALIHRVLHDLGGWMLLAMKQDDEWPFVAKEFQNRYRGYKGRNERPQYPSVMIGAVEAHNSRMDASLTAPVLIGEESAAWAVRLGGTGTALVALHRPADVSRSPWPAPSQEAS